MAKRHNKEVYVAALTLNGIKPQYMISKKTSIVYLAHGPKHLHKQSIFSILTLYRYLEYRLEGLNIVVYTDDVEIFKKHLPGFSISYEVLTPERINAYIKNDYVHRVKICVIQNCMKKYDTNVLFVDGDTYFLRSPIALLNLISPGITIFHKFEFTIADGGDEHEGPLWIMLRKLARNYQFKIQGASKKLESTSEMWNSGILGLSKEYYHLIEDVLDLNDQLTVKAPYKTAEQFSFAYILKRYSKLTSGEEYVYHYWEQGLKILFNYHIDIFLDKNLKSNNEEKALKAVELSKQQNSLVYPDPTLWQRLNLRAKLVLNVVKYGHL